MNAVKLRRRVGSVMVAVSLLTAGCRADRDAEERAATERATTAHDEAADQPACLAGSPFVADGPIEVRAAGAADADRIAALRWESYDVCERFVIDLGAAQGRPADGAGAVSAEVLRDLGVVRVSLRGVERADPDAVDATFDGSLARAAYVVRSPDGSGVFVDVHLADAAEAHVATLAEPARVVVDLRPGGARVPAPAPTHNRVVVLAPRPGEASYPLTVTGYARTFEANVVVRLEQDGADAGQDFTTATAWTDAWGHFSLTMHRGPAGRVVLHVGEHSARDGSWEGVAVDLEMR